MLLLLPHSFQISRHGLIALGSKYAGVANPRVFSATETATLIAPLYTLNGVTGTTSSGKTANYYGNFDSVICLY